MAIYIVVDVEADGPYPGDYSMVSFGACVVDSTFNKTFYGKVKPISDNYIKEALNVSGHSREEHLTFEEPIKVMKEFADWLKTISNNQSIVFFSDNNGFDWQFINFYFHKFYGSNPFGFSSRRIGDVFSGMYDDLKVGSKWKNLRRFRHTHNPVDDAKGNASALIEMKKMGLKF